MSATIQSHSTMSKRRRIDRACDACRRRKTKCDGPSMSNNICSNCMQSHKNCTYLEDSRPRGPPKAYITSLEDKVEKVEALLRMLGPDVDLDTELGPPIIRDSWKTDQPQAAPTASTSSRATILPTEPAFQHGTHLSPLSPNVMPSTRVPIKRYLHQKDRSRSSSHSASSSVVIVTPPNASPDHKRSPSSGSLDSWTASDESDDDSTPLSTDGKRLTMGPTESKNVSMESPLTFVGKSSTYGLSCKVRKIRAGYMDEATRAGVERDTGSGGGDHTPKYTHPHRRPEYWTTPVWELPSEGDRDSPPCLLPRLIASLPPTDLARKLIDLFFTNVNIHFPLLHRPTFERQWRKGLQFHDPWFSCLCLTVFAVSSRWCNDVRVLPDEDLTTTAEQSSEKKEWRRAGYKYFEACLPMHEVRPSAVTPACLSEIQAHAAGSIFLRGTMDDASAWLIVSIGLRKVQDRGAHRKKVYGNTPSVDEEQWKRAVWMLIVFDRLGSAHVGRPCCTREADFDLDLPVEVDDEYWENDDAALAFQQPTGKPALVTSFNSFIRLSQIMAFALITLYAVDKSKLRIGVPRGPKWKEEVVMHLNTAMTEWVDSVPEHLRWSPGMPNEIFANQASTLYTAYYLGQILIYRPFIPFPAISDDPSRPRIHPIAYPDFPFPAQAICINAAKSCARIVDAQLTRGVFNIPNLIAVSYISAALLLANIWDLKSKERTGQSGQLEDVKPQHVQMIQTLLEDVAVFMKALEYAELRWDNAHLSLQILKESLPGAVDESKPLRPMHILDPVYPQLPVDFDWGPSPQWLDNNPQPASSSCPPDFSQWAPASQMSRFPSMPYPQIDQQQSYSNIADLSHWSDRLYSGLTPDHRNSAYVPFPDDWSSQPPPIGSRSAHTSANSLSMDIHRSRRESSQIDEPTGGHRFDMHDRWQPPASDGNLDYWNGLSRYQPKSLSYTDSGITRGIYTNI